MSSREKMKLCPVLAKEYNIITIANMDSLQLSTYSRRPGTKVKVTCLSNTLKVLGPTWLTCQNNGTWDKPIPRCVSKEEYEAEQSKISTASNPTEKPIKGASPISESDSSFGIFAGSITPYIITVCVLAIMFLSLVFILTYLVRMRKLIKRKIEEIEEKDRRPAHVRIFDSLPSRQSGSTTVYDYFRQTNSPTPSASASSHSSERFKRTNEQDRNDAPYFNSLDQRLKHERYQDRLEGAHSLFDPRVKRTRSHEFLQTAYVNNYDQRLKRERDRDSRSLQYTVAEDRWFNSNY
ncbi:uncharacterized protein LOC133199007 isoform X1 [Saccostrea echinata]|uniref:uncharacterized protein LOC133199007 isoform X1 n=1 Tax=Saccostrea echinata TaxID=191078 RepID=UPI002A81C167|nr:uncharacterized protein LOC133199007 isoform X1 [Saccostrea echinata]XP_061190889.1 uncharacterized protein LOC133199007 isoform X1 [Saccostrea echinata]